VSGPNLGEAHLRIERGENSLWRAALRLNPDSADLGVTEPELPRPKEAWDAAFELYRLHVIT
jgi:hypothetical protein